MDQARKDFDLSRGRWLMSVVEAHLHRRDDAALMAMISEVLQGNERHDGELAKLQTNLARILFAMLTIVGEMKPEDAMDIVRNKLLA